MLAALAFILCYKSVSYKNDCVWCRLHVEKSQQLPLSGHLWISSLLQLRFHMHARMPNIESFFSSVPHFETPLFVCAGQLPPEGLLINPLGRFGIDQAGIVRRQQVQCVLLFGSPRELFHPISLRWFYGEVQSTGSVPTDDSEARCPVTNSYMCVGLRRILIRIWF